MRTREPRSLAECLRVMARTFGDGFGFESDGEGCALGIGPLGTVWIDWDHRKNPDAVRCVEFSPNGAPGLFQCRDLDDAIGRAIGALRFD